jgi:uncharacterized membrane protein
MPEMETPIDQAELKDIDKDQKKMNRLAEGRGVSVPFWMGMLALGFVFEFAGRFVGYRYNPLGIWHESAPLLGIVVAGLVALFGVLRCMNSWKTKDLRRFRQSLLIVLLGVCLLGFSYVSNELVTVALAIV